MPGGVVLFGTDELDARNERLFEALAALPRPERGGYLMVPPILSIDEWEQEALEAQEQLVKDTAEWLGPPPAEPVGKDPQDRSDAYKSSRPAVPQAFDAISDMQR